ncbi:UNVERIFIED_CONTAM: Kinesin-like protein KIN-7F [Sesamum radiatum]|uniref:Kinesin-like protein n=1 Tax=Sesamum radiatum TaxID=300843 RepID=A0AAW2S3F5_SESRA
MGAMGAEDLMNWDKLQGMGNGTEEKILVLVRLRPLSEKEIARNEVADWECINSTTILYRNSLQERSGLPTAYSFDRVFRGDCRTREVYDEGIKDIVLSVVGGINSTVFAYGQTSSGKTYTMNGITEYAVADIYDYIQKHEERAFVLKFSAMEIYNEVVRDLLSTDNTQLRLLDDPERGTIIEKLTEETLRDRNHLKELLSICEGLANFLFILWSMVTIESSAREFIGKGNSTTLAASVNFVDLAGSERASQALSVGQRLKEGCHINRSLLTLGTVIRKLSCAKEVSTNAKVNVVMSDKALVKHLQKEVARLESELRTPGSVCDHGALLRKKDMQIEKLEKEIRELKKQRDLAHSRIDDLLRAIEGDKGSQKVNQIQSVHGDFRSKGTSYLLHSENSADNFSSDDRSDPSQEIEDPELGIGEDSDEICKEVRCIEMDESGHNKTYEPFGQSTSESEESMPILSEPGSARIVEQQTLSASRRQVSGTEDGYGMLQQRIQGVQDTIDSLFKPHPDALSPGAPSTSMTVSGCQKLTRSQSCRANLMTDSPDFDIAEQNESTPPTVLDKSFIGRPEGASLRKQWKLPPVIYGADTAILSRNGSQSSDFSSFVDEIKNQTSSHGDEDIPTLGSFVAGLREMAKLQYENQTGNQVQETDIIDESKARDVALDPMNDWPLKFEKLQKLIVELWQACNISLSMGAPSSKEDDFADSIYMEVEYRRLSFLKETFARGNSAIQDGRNLTLASSKKALRREREMLSRLMYKSYTEDERNRLYKEWGISLNSKQRRLQLVHLLYSDTENMDHITKSAAIVANLIGFSEHGQALKEMLGLSFRPLRVSRRSFSWKNSMASLL